MPVQTPVATKEDSQRRSALLRSALSVFARYGYRKASMDEIARAAGVSLPGLYLQFADKEDLFRAAVQHHCADALNAALAALAALAREQNSIDRRLVTAFDEWLGRYVGMAGISAQELIADTADWTRSIYADHEKRLEQAVAKAIAASPLMAVYSPAA
jgi:AcrR family transcriptional regulator